MTTQEIKLVQQGQGFQPDESCGLFIGINHFDDRQIPTLAFAADDAVDLAFLFSCELELVPPARVHLALSGKPQKPETADQLDWLLSRGALRVAPCTNNICRQVYEVSQLTGQRGIYVVTAATHGFSDQGREFLAASDSWLRRLETTGIPVATLLDDIARALTPRCLLLLDTCRARLAAGTRALEGEGMSDSLARALSNATGLAVLSSTTLGGYSYEDEAQRNGIFTSYIVKGLRGQSPADVNGFITISSLAKYVNQEVLTWVKRNRENHVGLSRGITCTLEGKAGDLPIASPAPDEASRRDYRHLRELALLRLKKNIGSVITGEVFDEIANFSNCKIGPPNVASVLHEINALDGTEKSQRAFLYFYQQQNILTRLASLRTSDGPAHETVVRLNWSAKPQKTRAAAAKKYNQPSPGNRPFVFIAYAQQDRDAVSKIAALLRKAGYEPWIDSEQILPGQSWELEIEKAIRSSSFFLACLSCHSVSSSGFMHRELKLGLRILDEQPEGRIYLIPILIDDCQLPARFRELSATTMFSPHWGKQLIDSLVVGARQRKNEWKNVPD